MIDHFKQALRSRGGYEVVIEKVTGGRANFEGRVPNAARAQWGKIVDVLLDVIMDHDLPVDISQHHFKRSRGGERVYSWRFVISAASPAELDNILQGLAKASASAPRVMPTLDEFPLPGVYGNKRNEGGRPTANGYSRGASFISPKSGGGMPYRR